MKLWELRDTINALIELHGVNSRINVIYPCSNRTKLGTITGYEVVRDDREGHSTIKLKINHARGEEEAKP